jgi:L-ascorbate metabolism protein UlaG (beta-lactamase superfamily)
MKSRRGPGGFLTAAWVTLLLLGCVQSTPKASARLHYLGHASFLMEFSNGITVLTDYGESRAYGLNSPIYPLGEIVPHLVTLSHEHADHAGGVLPEGVGLVLRGDKTFEAEGLTITPIPTYEGNLETPDNVSFLFQLGELRILHMGDCQALITGLAGGGEEGQEDPGLRERIRQLYPDHYDVALLPIGFVTDILEEATRFATLLDADLLIPMHYWTPGDRDTFMGAMEGRRDARGRPYHVSIQEGPGIQVPAEGTEAQTIQVLGLTPAPPPHLRSPNPEADSDPTTPRKQTDRANP